jgi:ATP-dependent Clp protease protease subunit
VLIDGTIFSGVANGVVAQLRELDSQDPKAPIRLGIDSRGGSIAAALAIRDTMRHLSAPVMTVCLGTAEGAACLILASGRPGSRYAISDAHLNPHLPSVRGRPHRLQPPDYRQVVEAYAAGAGRPPAEVEQDLERDLPMAPDVARDWGLIDHTIPERAK